MSAQANMTSTPLPVGATIPSDSLRAEMEARRAAGDAFPVDEILGMVVPLCTRLVDLHARSATLYLHPSSLHYSRETGLSIAEDRAQSAPTLPRDRACLAPEQRKGDAGDAKASVFAIGAIMYEMLTASSVGPGMRRPADVVPDLPPQFELILGKALVADASHRPGDLGALAQALHQIAPSASIAPPPADPSQLDIEVDIRLSMIPLNERPGQPGTEVAIPKAAKVPQIQAVQGDGPFAVAIRKEDPAAQRLNNPTQRLADMKVALESDPRPRYVVVKDGMDHGPFSAVELLQQIATGSFTDAHILRDTFSQDERFIKDWEEFAPFAEQAKLNRAIVQEKKALAAVVEEEKRGTQYKALIGLAVIGVFAAGGLGWWMREKNSKERELTVQADEAVAVDVDGGLGAGKAGGPGGVGGPRPAGGGSHPVLSGGMSCEGARARYVEEYKMGDNGPADLTAGAYGAVLNRGTYLNSCGVPSSTSVTICAAVQNGRAVGVTVTMKPPNPGLQSCVAGQIRSMSFPSHPRLDVTTTSFSGN